MVNARLVAHGGFGIASSVLVRQVHSVDRKPHQVGSGDPMNLLKDQNLLVSGKIFFRPRAIQVLLMERVTIAIYLVTFDSLP